MQVVDLTIITTSLVHGLKDCVVGSVINSIFVSTVLDKGRDFI